MTDLGKLVLAARSGYARLTPGEQENVRAANRVRPITPERKEASELARAPFQGQAINHQTIGNLEKALRVHHGEEPADVLGADKVMHFATRSGPSTTRPTRFPLTLASRPGTHAPHPRYASQPFRRTPCCGTWRGAGSSPATSPGGWQLMPTRRCPAWSVR